MKRVTRLCAAALWAAALWGQARAPLSNKEALELSGRSIELMEATSVTTAELGRAAAPLVENARQAVLTMRTLSGQNAALTYTLLGNLKAYLMLASAVPQPQTVSPETERQFGELRRALNRLEAHFQALLEQKEAQLRHPDRDNLRRYAEANAKLPPPQPGRPRVVFLGDSITDGWRLNEYFPERDFVNRGISGQITGEMLGRMKADVIDLRPALLLVLAGTNDIARGVSLQIIQNNLTMIADLAEKHQIKPLFASLLPVSDYHKEQNPQYERSKQRPPATIRELNAWLSGFCRQRGYPYVDYFSALADASGLLRPELADDGLHPNSAGYRLMAPLAQEAIDKALKALEPKPRKKRLGIF